MSPSWIWSDKITNDRLARVGYTHFISNKGEWNNCFSKFSNRVLPPIFISTILQSVRKENLAHYFPYDVKLRLLAHSRSFFTTSVKILPYRPPARLTRAKSNTRNSVSAGYSNTKKRAKNTTRSESIFDEIRGAWIVDETLSRVFDMSSQSKQKLKSKIVKIYSYAN